MAKLFKMNAVITGATKGIGFAIAQKFVEKGFSVAICSRNEDDLAKAKADLLNINSAELLIISLFNIKL